MSYGGRTEVYTCNSSEVEAGGSRDQRHSELHSELEEQPGLQDTLFENQPDEARPLPTAAVSCTAFTALTVITVPSPETS